MSGNIWFQTCEKNKTNYTNYGANRTFPTLFESIQQVMK
jgi:hypothetical protein